ncbi:MAG: hypothetical protein R2755_29570 [Acidimicrobiales bacterium]
MREVLEGACATAGSVLVVDELGFHQATSVAELLADRGCAVEVVTNGMVVGQDLGVTLDMELWWMRAQHKGIGQRTDLVPMGLEVGEDGRATVQLLHHPTGAMQPCTVDWVVLAVPPTPLDGLYHALRGAGLPAVRVGDCVAPCAHAAVVDGECRPRVLSAAGVRRSGGSVLGWFGARGAVLGWCGLGLSAAGPRPSEAPGVRCGRSRGGASGFSGDETVWVVSGWGISFSGDETVRVGHHVSPVTKRSGATSARSEVRQVARHRLRSDTRDENRGRPDGHRGEHELPAHR